MSRLAEILGATDLPKRDNNFGENRLRLAPEAALAAQVLTFLTSPVVSTTGKAKKTPVLAAKATSNAFSLEIIVAFRLGRENFLAGIAIELS